MTNMAPAFDEKSARRKPLKRLTLVTSIAAACALTLILMNGLAGAQAPKDSQSPYANATPVAVQTSDGRAFSALSEKDIDTLPDADFDAYQKWRIRGKEQELARVDKRLAETRARLTELDSGIAGEWRNVAALFRRWPPEELNDYLRKDIARMTKLFEHIVSEKLPEHEYASELLESLRAKK